MPILKQLVAGSSQTKRRSRMELTTEMISAPLGDFRHTMHVGRSGEAFGDTSFLSSRSGEPPREAPTTAFPRSPRPGLLSRTFRSSKRSQSVNRVDEREENNTLAPPGGSPKFVKNAMSLPFLNDESEQDGGRALKSLTSSPMRQTPGLDSRASSNGAVAAPPQVLDLEQHEKLFGVLTDLRSPSSYNGGGGGGMKKAESVMSFHVDLGPSMLEDVLDIMEKEDDDLGFEEGKSSEGRASPPLSMHAEGDEEEVDEEQQDHHEDHIKEELEQDQQDDEQEQEDEEEEESELKVTVIEAQIETLPEEPEHQQQQQQQVRYELEEAEDVQNLHDPAPSPRPPSSVDQDLQMDAPYTPELEPKHLQHNTDSCSMSSSGSAALDDKPPSQQLLEVEAPGMTRYSPPPPVEEGEFSSFIEDEDDEIRV